MVRRMMNATDVVLNTATAEAATTANTVVRANPVAGTEKEAMVARRDGTTSAGLAHPEGMARATLEKVGEANTVVITANMDADTQAQDIVALSTIAAIPAVAWEQGVVTTRTGPRV
jgi:hypothetical protein